jgi:tetratricopeptide (TPR) repeat protein
VSDPPFSGGRSERLPELYLEALELDATARRELLERIGVEEPALAEELARLLALPRSVASPIDRLPDVVTGGIGTSASRAAGARLAADTAGADAPPSVGPYRIVRELGRGGMGRVFLAEQETPDFRRTVALKLIARPGSETHAVRRFRDEVRILASLEHPGIARFLDGGLSGEGIWYLALEYVDGRDLLDYARAEALSARARVELFVEVLDAVAYAHENGVVHRDLKPGNVLVSGDGRARLLDFGISKLVDPEAGGATVTSTQFRALTPAYASPEQFRGERISPRSDVYSLGVMLYELLAGRRPYATSGEPGGDSAPEPPSRVALRAARDGSASKASPRRRGPSGIGRDLDAICLKALELEPERRYDGAGPFRDDLRRYLAGQPVEARAGGRFGAAAAFVRRHRTVALLAALAAVAATAWIVPRERPAGETESALTVAPVPRFFPFDPTNPPPADESERRLAEAPDDLVAGAALAFRLARDQRLDEAKIVIGRMRQVPGGDLDPLIDYAEGRIASLEGEDQRALVFYTRARDRALAEKRPELLGAIRTSRAATLSKLGQRDASRDELEQARADSEAIGDARTLYRTLNGLALEYLQKGEMARGEAALEDALKAAAGAGIEPIVTLENLAAVHGVRGRPDLGEPLARRLVEHYRRSGRATDEGEVSKNLSQMVRDLGRPEEAAALRERALALTADAGNGNLYADALHAEATADLEEGRLDAVDPLVDRLEATGGKSLKRLPLGYARSLEGRKHALSGDVPAARRSFAEARRLMLGGGDRDLAAISDVDWAAAEVAAGDAEAALKILGEALAELDEPTATEAGYFAETLAAGIEAGKGQLAEARQRLERLGPGAASSPSFSRRISFLQARAALAAAESRTADASSDLEAALELARTGGRKLSELELRLAIAELELPAPAARAKAVAVEREARRLGYLALADRARLAAAPPPSPLKL